MPLLLCPNDNAAMQTINRNGVELDVCPTCRGVWLDRGELDKLIERSLGPGSGAWGSHEHDDEHRRREVRGGWRRAYDDDEDDDRPYRRRKTNWLKELFD